MSFVFSDEEELFRRQIQEFTQKELDLNWDSLLNQACSKGWLPQEGENK